MKYFLPIFLFVASINAAHLQFTFVSADSASLTNNEVRLIPTNSTPTATSSGIVANDFLKKRTDTNGVVTFSNILVPHFHAILSGPNGSTIIRLTDVPVSSNAVLQASNYMSAVVPADVARYLRPGTNVVFVTNAGIITIHGTAVSGAGGSATNAFANLATNGTAVLSAGQTLDLTNRATAGAVVWDASASGSRAIVGGTVDLSSYATTASQNVASNHVATNAQGNLIVTSNALRTDIDLKAPLASPTFSGIPVFQSLFLNFLTSKLRVDGGTIITNVDDARVWRFGDNSRPAHYSEVVTVSDSVAGLTSDVANLEAGKVDELNGFQTNIVINAQTNVGPILFATDNSQDIGASGANRPRDLNVARNAAIAGDVSGNLFTASATTYFGWSGRSLIHSPENSVVKMANNAQTDFNRLQFGGTTASFPALSRTNQNLFLSGADRTTTNSHKFGINTNNPQAELHVAGHVRIEGGQTNTGPMSASIYYGDGSQLTGLAGGGDVTTSQLNVASNHITTNLQGNIITTSNALQTSIDLKASTAQLNTASNHIVTNAQGNLIFTSNYLENAKQPASTTLTNLAGTGAITNAPWTNSYQPAHVILTNLSGTGAVTNANDATHTYVAYPAGTNDAAVTNLTVDVRVRTTVLTLTNNATITNYIGATAGTSGSFGFIIKPQLVNRTITWLVGTNHGVVVRTNAGSPLWTTLTNGLEYWLTGDRHDTNLVLTLSVFQ